MMAFSALPASSYSANSRYSNGTQHSRQAARPLHLTSRTPSARVRVALAGGLCGPTFWALLISCKASLVSLALGQRLGISDIGRIAIEIVQDILDRASQHLFVGFLRDEADVRGTDDVVELQEGIARLD